MAKVIISAEKVLVSYEISRPGYVSIIRAVDFDGAWWEVAGLEAPIPEGATEEEVEAAAWAAYRADYVTPEKLHTRFVSRAEAMAWVDGTSIRPCLPDFPRQDMVICAFTQCVARVRFPFPLFPPGGAVS